LTSNLFFIEKKKIDGRRMVLEGPEHHHLFRVVRSQPGDIVRFFDEDGDRYEARIETIGTARTELVLLARTGPAERRTRIILGQALLKAKAMDLVVQKAAEFGLFAVVPIVASRSVARIEEGGGKKIERWTKIAREASKQSKWGLMPRIHLPLTLAAFLRGRSAGFAFFLSENDGRPLRDVVAGVAERPPAEAAALIGPEGGWTRDEEALMIEAGLEAVSLGRAILRAETAAIAAAAILSHFWIS
jgi:16S rRNA (uracil1498-N3)-methyltransferase